jgi:hypothetical protein
VWVRREADAPVRDSGPNYFEIKGAGCRLSGDPQEATTTEETMSLEQVLSAFPADSVFRGLIPDLVSRREKVQDDVYTRILELPHEKAAGDRRTPNWMISEREAQAILNAAACVPMSVDSVWDGLCALIYLVMQSPHPSLAPSIARAYPKVATSMQKSGLLALLGAIGTREASEIFLSCVREHGWPEGGCAGRVFTELTKLMPFADVLLPDLFSISDETVKPDLVYTMVTAISAGRVQVSELGDHLEVLAPYVLSELRKGLRSAAKRQGQAARTWRVSQAYFYTRQRLSLLMEIAGYLKQPKLLDPLRQAEKFKDPLLIMSALLALLRRGEQVSAQSLKTAAGSHETRAQLYDGLCALKKEGLFPKKWKTWEAFAAAAMVEWLLYPSELGREPDTITQEHIEFSDKRKKIAFFVWKFGIKGEPPMAGVSGPHELRGEPHPLHSGGSTFSDFEAWKSATAEEHLVRCLRIVNQAAENS